MVIATVIYIHIDMTGKGASLQATFGAVNLRKFQASLAWWKSRSFNGKIIAHVLFLFVV